MARWAPSFLDMLGVQEHLCAGVTCISNMQVDSRIFPHLNSWNRNYTLESLLTELRREMAAPHNRKLPQPAEGTMY